MTKQYQTTASEATVLAVSAQTVERRRREWVHRLPMTCRDRLVVRTPRPWQPSKPAACSRAHPDLTTGRPRATPPWSPLLFRRQVLVNMSVYQRNAAGRTHPGWAPRSVRVATAATDLPMSDPGARRPHAQVMARHWLEGAACVGEDPELFFPIGTAGPGLLQLEAARAVCNRCPVIAVCLSFALETGQDAGVWGGLSEDERRSLRSSRQRSPVSRGTGCGVVPTPRSAQPCLR